MKAAAALGVIIIIVASVGAYLLLKGGGGDEKSKSIKEILESDPGGDLKVCHWWTIEVEERGFEKIMNGMENQYPNATITPEGGPGSGGGMPQRILPALNAGTGPEVFQSHPGYEAAAYGDYLLNLDDLWQYDNLEQRTPTIIKNMCKMGGHYNIVPVGVHRTNVIWYNKTIFSMCGVTAPSGTITFEEFWQLCDSLKNSPNFPSGAYVLDVGDGLGTNWAATQIFESIMAGLGLQTYQDFINGKATVEQIKPVLENFKKFLEYIPADHLSRRWDEVCADLNAGYVAMYLHGDWVKAKFSDLGMTYGNQYGSFSVPGTSAFGLCVDGFVVPEQATYFGNGLRWVHSYTTDAVQTAFNPTKGSVSPYTNISLSIYSDAYSVESAREVQAENTKFYPSITHGSAVPYDVLFSLHTKINEFVLNRDVDASASAIKTVLGQGTYITEWHIV